MKANFEVVYAHKKIFNRFKKITFLISHCGEIFPVDFIEKDTASIYEAIKWVFITPSFGDGF